MEATKHVSRSDAMPLSRRSIATIAKKSPALPVTRMSLATGQSGMPSFVAEHKRLDSQKLARPPQAPPLFNDTPESILKEARLLVDAARRVRDHVVATVTPQTATFANTLLPILQEENDRLIHQRRLEFLKLVSPSEELREASSKADEMFGDFWTDADMDVELHKLLVAVSERNEPLDAESQRALEGRLRMQRTNGLSLPENKKQRLREIKKEIGRLTDEAEKNIGADKPDIWVPEAVLAGVPTTVVDALESGDGPNQGKRRIPYSRSGSIMQQAQVSASRKFLYIASQIGCRANVQILEKLMVLRDEAARLLGHSCHAELRLQAMMEPSVEKINSFLDNVRHQLGAKASLELARLKALKAQDSAEDVFYLWDLWYYCRKMEKVDCAVDNGKVSEYFPLTVVATRMLDLFSHIFGMSFRELSRQDVADLEFGPAEEVFWHEDVTLYAVWDTTTTTADGANEFLGYLYMDLYPRAGKYHHLADFSIQPGYIDTENGRRCYPATAMVCNMPKPTQAKPSLLAHQEVWLLFHELGHGIHDLVSKTKYASYQGAETGPDFNEAPSQMLENWCWDVSIIKKLSQHYSTVSPEYLDAWRKEQNDPHATAAEEIPDELATSLIKAREARRAMWYLHNLHKMIFDLQIYQPPTVEAAAAIDTTLLWYQLEKDVLGMDGLTSEEISREQLHGPALFAPVFRGNDARYFCYLSTQVYAADMFVTAFQADPMNAEQGIRYRHEILEKGGSGDPMTMMTRFLGRPPRLDAFCEQLGLPRA